MEGIGLISALAVAWGLGYWAAHIRLTNERIKVLRCLAEATRILAHLESDRSKGGSMTDHPGP